MKTDSKIQYDVMEEIKCDPQLKDIANEIGVSVKEGVVTLTGILDSYANKVAAEKATQRVAGVKVVAVDIEVTANPSKLINDPEIALAIKNALTWHSAVNEDQIELKVDKGWVYLDGTVEWDYMKKAAEKAVADITGVRGITNRIRVAEKEVDPAEVKRQIIAAFHRSATVDSSNVHTEVSGGTVILTGIVRTWAERQDAVNAAIACPGAETIIDKIEIDPAMALP